MLRPLCVRRLFDQDLGLLCIRPWDFLVLVEQDITLVS
jgi:hypothetical protein